MDSLQPKMNYYNTGFIGGFLYNLKVEAMDQPRAIQKKLFQKLLRSIKSWPRRNTAEQ